MLHALMMWLSSLWYQLLYLMFPPIRLEQAIVRPIPPAVRWTLHAILVLAIAVLLFFVNRWLGLAQTVPVKGLQDIWLPGFFLLTYAAILLMWLIWRWVTYDPGMAAHPEIDAAWEEARRALDQAGIKLTDAPLFLVVGRPDAPQQHLFGASQLPFVIRNVPADHLDPIHVYASHEAIYVICPGASLMGKHAANLALEGIGENDSAVPIGAEGAGVDATMLPNVQEERVLRAALAPGQGPARSLQRRQIRRASGFKIPNILTKREEVDRLSAALAHLCRLIRRDRAPECPLNGVLFLLPLGATDSRDDAQVAAQVLERDLATIREASQLRCPVFALLCDMEHLPGFRDFVLKKLADAKRSRIGQRFPLELPDQSGPAVLDLVERSIYTYFGRTLRDLVYPLFEIGADGADVESPLNRNLYLLLDEMRERKYQLAHVLSTGLKRFSDGPLLYGGCYVAATGADEREQGFVKGVFSRLSEAQSYVAWTDDALRQDERRRRWATLGYTAIVVMVTAVAATGAWAVFRPRRTTR